MHVDEFNELCSRIDAIDKRMDGMAVWFGRIAKEVGGKKAVGKSELLDQAPPSDLETERAVLACLLLKPGYFHATSEQITESDFGDNAMRQIYAAMLWIERNGKVPDATLLLAQLKEDGQYGTDDGVQFIDIFDLFKLLPLVANLGAYVDRLKEMSHRRRAIERGIQLVQAAHNRIP